MGAYCCGSVAVPQDAELPCKEADYSREIIFRPDVSSASLSTEPLDDCDLHSCNASIFEPEQGELEIRPAPGVGRYVAGATSHARVMNRWWLSSSDLDVLANGDTYFTLLCRSGAQLSDSEKDILGTCFGLTSFRDEAAENGVEPINLHDPGDLRKHTFILARAVYLLPHATLDEISVDMLASTEYHKRCQPGSPKIWDDCAEPRTFRMTKKLAFMLSMCVQFKCSEVSSAVLPDMTRVTGGLRPHRAVLMERTKRTLGKQDSTKVCKSILFYHQIQGGGIICVNTTCLANTSMPAAGWVLNQFGSSGAQEVLDTATLTRRYLGERRAGRVA